MANPFDSATISAAYRSDEPTDDGASTANNTIEWAKHTSKLSEPLRTLAESDIVNTDSAFAKVIGGGGVVSTAISRTSTDSDQGKLIVATASGITLTTPDATSVESPFVYKFSNISTGNITLDGSGAQTIDGADTVIVPAGKGGELWTDGTNWFTAGKNFDVIPTLPRGYLGGLQTANGTDADHDTNIAAGSCRSADDSANLVLSTAFVKEIDASWAVGTAAGGLANGVSLSADTWYHLFLVDLDAGGTDAGFDTSLVAANLLATTDVGTVYRRIASVLTDSSLNILDFNQLGNEFLWDDPTLDQTSVAISTTTISLDVKTPLGIKTWAMMNVQMTGANDAEVYISSPDADGEPASTSVAPLASMNVGGATSADPTLAYLPPVRTNVGSEINAAADANRTISIVTLGWIDPLGRFD